MSNNITNYLKSLIFECNESENYTTVHFPEELIFELLSSYDFWQYTIEVSQKIDECKGKYVKSKDVEECFNKINSTTDKTLQEIYALEFVGLRNNVVRDKIDEILKGADSGGR